MKLTFPSFLGMGGREIYLLHFSMNEKLSSFAINRAVNKKWNNNGKHDNKTSSRLQAIVPNGWGHRFYESRYERKNEFHSLLWRNKNLITNHLHEAIHDESGSPQEKKQKSGKKLRT